MTSSTDTFGIAARLLKVKVYNYNPVDNTISLTFEFHAEADDPAITHEIWLFEQDADAMATLIDSWGAANGYTFT